MSKQPLKDPKGGLTSAGRKAAKRDEGANLKPGVKSYASASTADKKRWISWAQRFAGQSKLPPLKDDKGKSTRFALSFAAWGEPVPTSEAAVRAVYAKAQARQKQLANANLSTAQGDRAARGELLAVQRADCMIDAACDAVQLAEGGGLKNYQQVTTAEREKLKGLIGKYRKEAHPFRACVRDNVKRFPGDRVNKVCAVMTDLVHGTTKWRNKNFKGKTKLSTDAETCTVMDIDADMFALLERISQVDYIGLLDNQETT